ncbi:hypothetical protein KORDIASMS9_00972 [Kordia sp. SMS9]|uniref:WD40 repeat domain-containing protein n=1 Tax=Kordia sp. SMS9 TaxID=2282170 RepID=UPI000E0D1AEA|nr:WD40 repeat domain-containing protein [Kordia sp. SMS9]AXG68756.1 hypothetical protein KORDIASMS9_00972 [Kordia sp. SMS9]
MKKTIFTLLTFLVTLTTFAQAPELVNYQAIIRNSDGNLVQDSNIGMRVSILQTNATGTAVYTETHTVSTNTNGLVTIMIGGGTSSDDFSAIDWSTGPYFIKTETDIAGGTNYTITGTSQLLSVPYALYAKTAGSVSGGGSSNQSATQNPLNLNNNTSFAFKSSDENKIYAWSNQGSWSFVSYTNTAYGAGSLIASNGNFAFKASDDNKMYAWSFVTYNWTSVDYTNTAYGAGSITASKGNFIFKGSDDNKYFVWNGKTGVWSSISYVNTAYGPNSLTASEGNFAFKSSDENKIYAWSAHTGTWSSVSYTNTAYGASSITASNGNFIFKARDDNMYYVWNAEDGVWTGTSYPNTAYGAGNIVVSPHNEN